MVKGRRPSKGTASVQNTGRYALLREWLHGELVTTTTPEAINTSLDTNQSNMQHMTAHAI
jgi:hypothetical protein